ncbi:hypothetical protein DXG01_009931 [Tephrocybe rancida]|nr:hypothetical protein DXG01_009931 [Tephrocybe rancida]
MDDLSSNVPHQLPIQHVSAFDFDDAFSDGDPNELAYHFSPDSIREDMARHMPPVEAAWTPNEPGHSNGVFRGQNHSVSTLDIDGSNGRTSLSLSPSPPQTPHLLSPELSDHFSQISLDNENDEPVEGHEPAPGSNLEDANITPNVTIDTTADTTQTSRVPLSLEQRDDEYEGPTTPQSSSFSEYPPDSAQSTQSLPPPPAPHPATSVPRPLSATPTVPIISAVASTSEPHSNSLSPSYSAPPPQPKQKPFSHRPTRSIGPSALEKVRSKTRPVFLPPKPRKEDNKHMADWQSMMKTSRAIAEKKRKALQERRLAREKSIEESIHVWEREIVPDWKVVHKNPALRRLWWKGIPTKLRAFMWERAVGNALSLSKDHYRISLSRAKRALNSNVFPQASLDLIEKDILTTLPSLHIFHPQTGPLYEELREMLCAWVVARSDEGLGYTPGAARIAAMLLINMPVQQGFVAMRNLLDRHCMRSFYGGEGAREDHQILPSAYLNDWLLPLFLDHLPFEACARIWDVLLLEGDSFLYRAALGILAVLEPRLFFPDRKELMELLKGENKAALEVAKREGQPLDAGKYEVYGVNEETLWERIDQMDEWWKESTWTRLLQRELPDM